MDIRWLTAFIDLPDACVDDGVAFWEAITGSARSPWRGDREEFATLIAPTGDPHLRVQRLADGAGGIHLDLHVTDLAEASDTARAAGAVEIADHGHRVMSSPAGFVFCLVDHDGESAVSDVIDPHRPHVVDQVCIDVPTEHFDAEYAFWRRLTGWEAGAGSRAEFSFLGRRPELPLRLLFQRLGDDDPAHSARAHLDLACGDHRHEIAVAHGRLGARTVAEFPRWIALEDPCGLPYCLTGREPAPGRRSG